MSSNDEFGGTGWGWKEWGVRTNWVICDCGCEWEGGRRDRVRAGLDRLAGLDGLSGLAGLSGLDGLSGGEDGADDDADADADEEEEEAMERCLFSVRGLGGWICTAGTEGGVGGYECTLDVLSRAASRCGGTATVDTMDRGTFVRDLNPSAPSV